MRDDCTVVVMACDSHADVATAFGAMWQRFWPDCPFDTCLVMEERSDHIEGFDSIFCPGKRKDWCLRLANVLNRISSPYVMLFCDDYLLTQKIDTDKVMMRLRQAQQHDVLNLRLSTTFLCYLVPYGDTGLMEYPKSAPYCIATQPGFWNRESLYKLAAACGSAWDLERRGSVLVRQDPHPILSAPTREFPFVDSVRRGLWYPPAIRICAKNGVILDTSYRHAQSVARRLSIAIKDKVFNISPTFFSKLQNVLSGVKE